MLVRVVNDNTYPYKEKWRDSVIEIAPKGFVEMDFYEANLFLGTMPPNIQVDNTGRQIPASYKMLRIENIDRTRLEEPEQKHVCQSCKKEFQTLTALNVHSSEHLDQMIDEKAVEKVKNGRGRPRKDAVNDTGGHRDGGEA